MSSNSPRTPTMDQSSGKGSSSMGRVPHRLETALRHLRRYARAATGSQATGDALVRDTLEAALADEQVLARVSSGPVGLFGVFSTMWSSVDPQADEASRLRPPHGTSQLGRLPTLCRQALLLNRLEAFSLADTAQILGITQPGAAQLVGEALDEIAGEPPARVLIVEDEPLIADHLADIIGHSGHSVVAHATTAEDARSAFAAHRPGLILSDVQLGDGSSGIDAVDDILREGPVPVIFITAFPQKLLTGEGREPAFLITKPFRDDAVRAAISQALFFGSDMG
jgi:CheY-like chemotaxis protein